VGVFPAQETTPAGLVAFAKTYQLVFPLQVDAGHQLTRQLHARVTPEAVVVGPDGRPILYQGRLDDAYAGLGQHRPVMRHHELAEALATVAVPRTEPVDCCME